MNTEARIRESFGKQQLMATIGAEVSRVGEGVVELTLPYRQDLTQQHGYLHAGIVTTLLDTACGYAALSAMPPGKEVVSVEFKVNLLSPAVGDRFRAVGVARKSGRTLTVTTGELYALSSTGEKLVALLQGTMFAVDGAS